MEAITEYVDVVPVLLLVIAILMWELWKKLNTIHKTLRLSLGQQEATDVKLGHIRGFIHPFHRERFPNEKW